MRKKEPLIKLSDAIRAFCEDGTWLERQGVYSLTLAEAKQRAVDILESVPTQLHINEKAEIEKEQRTQTETQNSNLTFEKDECAKEYEELGLKELKELINADRKTENCSEKPNNCEPKICDTCRYYNSNIPCGSTPSACKEADKFAEEFVDGLKKLKPKDEPQTENLFTDKDGDVWKWRGDAWYCISGQDEPQVVMPKKCKGCDSASKIIEAYSRGFEDGAEAVKAVQTDCE